MAESATTTSLSTAAPYAASSAIQLANVDEDVKPILPNITVTGQPAEYFQVVEPGSEAFPPVDSERNAAQDETSYPTGVKLNLILLSVGLVLVVSALDATIVATAVPKITDEFHTVADLGWYSSGYRLMACGFQFMFGKMYTVFSFKIIFLVSVVIFTLASVLCATAPTSAAFVTGRAVSGFACAGVIAGCFILLVQLLPLRKRPMYAGVLAAVEGLATIAAPVLGGVITDQLGWRWCFWISVPSGAVTFVFLFFFLQDVRPTLQMSWREKLAHLDLLGNAIFVPALTCLFIALGWAGSKYPWNSATVIGLFCTFAVLITVFAMWQYRLGEKAALPPRVLANRSVLAGALFSACCNSALNVVEYYLPTYFQAIREYDATRSGFLLFPMLAGFIVGMLVQGFATSASGYYVPSMLVGSVLMPIFSGLLTTIRIDSELVRVLCYSGFYGLAGGIGFQGPQSAVQASLPDSDASIALSIITFSQGFGPAVFVTAAQSIFTNRLSANLQDLAPGLNATSIENFGLTDLKDQIGADKLTQVLAGLDKSLMQTWYLAIALACVTMVGSLTVEWRSVKEKKQ